jgi:hypothetical protein
MGGGFGTVGIAKPGPSPQFGLRGLWGDQVLQLSQAGASVTPIDWVRDSEFP